MQKSSKLVLKIIFYKKLYLVKICERFNKIKSDNFLLNKIESDNLLFHLGGPINCKVGHWSEWSPCSKTCGIGESKKTREVVRKAKRGGNDCPPLGMISNKINTQIYTLCVSGCHYLVNLHVL